MAKVKPTLQEGKVFALTGKLPKSLKKRRALGESNDRKKLQEIVDNNDHLDPSYQVAVDRLQELDMKENEKKSAKANKKESQPKETPKDPEEEKEPDTYPEDRGGGWFRTSDGKKFRDEKLAEEHQKSLEGDS